MCQMRRKGFIAISTDDDGFPRARLSPTDPWTALPRDSTPGHATTKLEVLVEIFNKAWMRSAEGSQLVSPETIALANKVCPAGGDYLAQNPQKGEPMLTWRAGQSITETEAVVVSMTPAKD